MTVKDFFITLEGTNSIQFATSTCDTYEIEDKNYCRASFYHKFRNNEEVWNAKITRLHTSVKPLYNTYETVFTIFLETK